MTGYSLLSLSLSSFGAVSIGSTFCGVKNAAAKARLGPVEKQATRKPVWGSIEDPAEKRRNWFNAKFAKYMFGCWARAPAARDARFRIDAKPCDQALFP